MPLRARSIPLGTWGGTALRLDPAVPVALAYLVFAMNERYQVLFPVLAPRSSPLAFAALAAAIILGTLLAGELVHVLVARAFGARIDGLTVSLAGGRSTLATTGQPAVEVEWRAVLLTAPLLILFGAVSMAVGVRLGIVAGAPHMLFDDLGKVLVVFGAAQALPVFPFAGGRILRALAGRRLGMVTATRIVVAIGKVLALVSLALAVHDRHVLFLFVGVYLYAGAVSERAEEPLAASLAGLCARDAMRPVAGVLSVRDRLGELPRAFARAGVSALPIMNEGGAPLGAIAVADLRRVPRRRRARGTIADLLADVSGVTGAAADLASIRQRLLEAGQRALAVVDASGAVIGVVTLDTIERRIALAELGA